jgi:adenosyl cobinamide kinase/adenosyl cobinamide phosphate guanylyltransferase
MYPSLAARGISIRRGEVSLIAGQPASGKSTLAMALAVRAKVPTLYVSADTHAHTQSLRLIAMLTNTDQAIIEPAMQDKEWAAEMLAPTSHIRWDFDSAPTVQSVEQQLEAHVELFSRAPELVVIDNLTDMVGGEGTEWEGMRTMMKDFKFLCREYDFACLILHHMSEGVVVPHGQCPPRYALQGKVAQTPALVLSITQDDAGFLGVCPVKSRYSQSCPSGTDVSWLRYSPAEMQITEVEKEFQSA